MEQERKSEPLTTEEKLSAINDRVQKIAKSFDSVKKNPLNLHLLMSHVGLISLTMDELLRDYADLLKWRDEQESK